MKRLLALPLLMLMTATPFLLLWFSYLAADTLINGETHPLCFFNRCSGWVLSYFVAILLLPMLTFGWLTYWMAIKRLFGQLNNE